ncbi:hypothetical protein EMCRGX_G016971, partial [Ephydatia muelleri]
VWGRDSMRCLTVVVRRPSDSSSITNTYLLSTFPASTRHSFSIQSGSERILPDKMADDTHAKSCKRSRQDDDQDLQRKGKKLKDSADPNEEPQCLPTSQRQDVPCGLANLGNTCYMNAALQCLGSVVPLKDFFIKKDLNSCNCIACEVSSVIRQMWSRQPLRTAVQPTNIMNEIGKCNERFSGGTQQDSQEFLLSLLEQLHAATKVPCSEDPCSSSTEIDACISGNVEAERKWTEYLNKHGKSVVVELFEGQFQSSMKCKGCGEFTYKFDPFMFLPTPIPSTEHERPPLTLRDCLGVMFKEETFDGKAWSCSKCHQKTDMTRKLSISRMPQIVMIYLKRFQNDKYGRRVKLNTSVEIPFRDLDLSSLMSSPNHPSPKYRLFAAINHSGTIHGGHYTAYANREGQWFHFNDEYVTKVTQCSERTVTAYVLFYEKDNQRCMTEKANQ